MNPSRLKPRQIAYKGNIWMIVPHHHFVVTYLSEPSETVAVYKLYLNGKPLTACVDVDSTIRTIRDYKPNEVPRDYVESFMSRIEKLNRVYYYAKQSTHS